MASAGAAQMLLQSVFNGSISMQDMEVERRPYHKNCGCALHNLKAICPNFCPPQRLVSFPYRASSLISQASISSTTPPSKSPSQIVMFKGSLSRVPHLIDKITLKQEPYKAFRSSTLTTSSYGVILS